MMAIEILMLTLGSLSLVFFSAYTISMIFYLSSDRPRIADRLRRYGGLSGK